MARAGLRGNLGSIASLKSTLRQMPILKAQAVAARAAPTMTARAQQSLAGGTTVYGDARPTGVDGQALTLYDTGATQRNLAFKNTGTIIRAGFPRYVKFLIGKYRVLPMGALPVSWRQDLERIVRETRVNDL